MEGGPAHDLVIKQKTIAGQPMINLENREANVFLAEVKESEIKSA